MSAIDELKTFVTLRSVILRVLDVGRSQWNGLLERHVSKKVWCPSFTWIPWQSSMPPKKVSLTASQAVKTL